MRKLLAAFNVLAVLSAPMANAEPGNAGPGPSPGLCDYPAVCGSGVDGALISGYYYWEDMPVELNGSHRHCEWGGGQTNGAVGFSMLITAGVTGPVGGVNGACYYVCPDGQLAAMPNPPGGWKDAIRPTKCQPVGRNPFLPPPPPEGVPIAPPIVGPITPPPAQQLPSVTDPVCPNPDATVNAQC